MEAGFPISEEEVTDKKRGCKNEPSVVELKLEVLV